MIFDALTVTSGQTLHNHHLAGERDIFSADNHYERLKKRRHYRRYLRDLERSALMPKTR